MASNKPATSRPEASGIDAVQVAPISKRADRVRAMMVRGDNDSQS